MQQEALAPIVLFVYNRPAHTEKVLNALSNNPLASQSKLYIFADGPKKEASAQDLDNIAKTRALLDRRTWAKEVKVVMQEQNKGLAASIVDGVTQIINAHGKVIVLEDDIVVSPFFLQYMNQALNIYAQDEQVMHIGSFVPQRKGQEKLPETYFLSYMNCWGWATWKRAWQQLQLDSKSLLHLVGVSNKAKRFELDNSVALLQQLKDNLSGKINTWAIKWYSTIFLQNGLCLYPKQALSQQIGMDGSGEHCAIDHLQQYQVSLANRVEVNRIPLKEDQYAYKYLRNFYRYGNFSGFKALKHRLRIFKQVFLRNIESLTSH